MKNYRVTVNGNTYDVTVEEVGENSSQSSQVLETTQKAYTPPSVNTPSNTPIANGHKVTCPMPGTVLNILVNQGDVIKENQPVIILEAMKMENEIVSTKAGTVASIAATKGAKVNSGDLLMVIS